MLPLKLHYWQIDKVAWFYALASICMAIFILGLSARIKIWAAGSGDKKRLFSLTGIASAFAEGVLGKKIFKGQRQAAAMHTMISLGFLGLLIGTVIVALDYWVTSFLKGSFYLWFSACLEIFGAIFLVGLIWALVRRYAQKISRLERRPEDLIAPVWLLMIALSGFMVEATRLAAEKPAFASYSFIGWWMSKMWVENQGALSIYRSLWWSHAVISLSFLAYIPFGKLFHVIAAPVGLMLVKNDTRDIGSDNGDPALLNFKELIFLDACTRCGRCVDVCPSACAGEKFTPRDFLLWARNRQSGKYHPLSAIERFKDWYSKVHGNGHFDLEKVWHCTTCSACEEICPARIATPKMIQKMRAKIVEEGEAVPALLSQALERIDKYNNPTVNSKRTRAKWAEGLGVDDLTSSGDETGLCYFVGCTTSMDNRAQNIARSFVKILKHAGIAFSTMGNSEPCCGDIALRVGENGLFDEKMNKCLELFKNYDITNIVTSSPHCFHTFNSEYTRNLSNENCGADLNLRFRHYTELIAELIMSGAICFETPLKIRVTYHDPCYLGRYSRVFDKPRQILNSIPGLEMLEMKHSRENSRCCGGGGGRMWQEDFDGETKMSEIRIREAAETGASVLVTACPLCLIMLEDACKTANLEGELKVMDLNEVVAEALGLNA